MKAKRILAALILGGWLAAGIWTFSGCGVYTEITVTKDSIADFSRYKTFAWLPDQYDTVNSPYNNQIIRNNLKNYFGQSFTERGFTVNLDTPDLLLHLVIVNKKEQRELPPHYPPYYYNPYYYGSRYYFPYPYDYYYHNYIFYCYPEGYCREMIQYVEGSITLEVLDRKENKLIWSGTAKGDIYDPAYINEDIHPAVKRIMKKFPLKPVERKKGKETRPADEVFSKNRS